MGKPPGRHIPKSGKLDRAWMDRANCLGVDPQLFFPQNPFMERQAKDVCSGCVVRPECRDYAMKSNAGRREVTGIWSGINFERPRELRKKSVA